MISKILVATDGSETALRASKYAIQLAKQLRASITILSVVDNRSLTNYYMVPPEATPIHIVEPIQDFLRQAAEREVAIVKKLCDKGGIPCRTVISSGHPAEEIIKVAERSRSHLIILGSHGKGTLAAAFLGSVTYGVIHNETHIPILVVRRSGER